MKTAQWTPKHIIKARQELERMIDKEFLHVEEENSFTIDLKQLRSRSVFSRFLSLFSKNLSK